MGSSALLTFTSSTGTNKTSIAAIPSLANTPAVWVLTTKVVSNTITVSSVAGASCTWSRVAGPAVDTNNSSPHTQEIWLGTPTWNASLLAASNGDFEQGTTAGWSKLDAATGFAVDSTRTNHGAWSGKITPSASTAAGSTGVQSAAVSFGTGTGCMFVAWVYDGGGGLTYEILPSWNNGAAATAVAVTPPTGQWYPLVWWGSVPSGATGASLIVRVASSSGTPSASSPWWLDDAMIQNYPLNGTVTLTPSSSTSSVSVDMDLALFATPSVSPTWARDTAAFKQNTTTTVAWQSLTPASVDELFVGRARCPGGGPYGTPPSGFSLIQDANSNPFLYGYNIGSTVAPSVTSGANPNATVGLLLRVIGNIAAAATLAGTGTLAGTASDTTTAAATLTGVSGFGGAATDTTTGAATLAGAGSLGATPGASTVPATATLSGTGSLAASGTVADATLTGVGTLAANPAAQGTATLTGTGTLAASATVAETAAATLAGSGSLAAPAAVTEPAAATLAGTGSLGSAPSQTEPAAATMTGVGSLAATGSVAGTASATLAGKGALGATATVAESTSATLTGTGTLAATARVAEPAAATLAGVGSLSAAPTLVPSTAATMTGTGTLAATGADATTAAATLAGSGSLAAAGKVTEPTAATLAGKGSLAATAALATTAAATMAGKGTLTGAATPLTIPALATLTARGTLAATVAMTAPSSATLAGRGTLAAGPSLLTTAAVVLAAQGTLAAAIHRVPIPRDITLSATLTLGWATMPPVGNPVSADSPLINPLTAVVALGAWAAGQPYIQLQDA